MLPLNLLSPTGKGAYLMTGTWSTKALKEANRCSNSFALWGDDTHRSVPASIPATDATYVHYTSNNTIYGTQYNEIPTTDSHLVVDMSSDICSRPVDVSKFDVIFWVGFGMHS